jgi:hypothetical protein
VAASLGNWLRDNPRVHAAALPACSASLHTAAVTCSAMLPGLRERLAVRALV